VTWYNTIAEFPFLSVGLVYSPIPLGGALTLLFIIEHLTIGRPARATDPHLPVE
jgi:TRAP-type C4-dicarboxylate transport system permease small subunit